MGPRSPLHSDENGILPSSYCHRLPSRTCTSGSPDHEAPRPALAGPGHIELGGNDGWTLRERFSTVRGDTCSGNMTRHRLLLSASDGAWTRCPARLKGAARFRSSGLWTLARVCRAQVVGIPRLFRLSNTLNCYLPLILETKFHCPSVRAT